MTALTVKVHPRPKTLLKPIERGTQKSDSVFVSSLVTSPGFAEGVAAALTISPSAKGKFHEFDPRCARIGHGSDP
jgi:hypothetical protein